MSFQHKLVRLNPYEGLCLTADDLATDQLFHRRSLQRHALMMHSFGVGEVEASKRAMDAVTNLFTPITTAWGTIVTASFGVNAANTVKGK